MDDSNRLRILIVSKQYPPTIGGGGSHAFYLASELSLRKDVDVHVLTSTVRNKPHYERIKERNLVVHRVNFGHTETLPYEGAIRKGLQLCKSINPHIIHGQHIAGSLIGLHLKAAFKKPLVITLHKTPMLNWEPTKIKNEPLYSFIKFLSQLETIEAFIAGSRAFKRELRRFGVLEEKVKLIYHGIPIKWFKNSADSKRVLSVAAKIGMEQNDNLIICPSRLDEKRKEIDVFLKASAILKQRISDRKFVFLITGTAENKEEKKYREYLEELATFLKINDCVKFLNEPIKFEEMPALYRLAEACVLPSITEGLGLVLIEALAVRTPVIGSNTSGIREVIKTNEKHGLRFQVGDHKELATQLIQLFTDENLLLKLRREGFKWVKKQFDAKLMVDSHLELYKELINKKARN